jgi:scyllo-inositol 2-dehydrogenase (NADP+)
LNSDRKSAVSLIGFGPGGRIYHAPFISVTEELDLAVIVTSNPARADQACAEYPHARVVNTADELFGNPAGIDVAVITTPNRTHVPLALAALEAGLHVVVDKPLAPTSAEARRLADEADRRGLLLTPYHNRRFDGDFLTLRRLLREHALGETMRFESRFERWRPEPKPGWRESADPADAGGVLFDLGPHLIDQALVLFGGVTEVYAEIARRRAGVVVDDDVFIALTHASGVRSHLWMSALAANPGPRFRVLGRAAAYTKFGMDVQEAALLRGDRPRDINWGVESAASWGTLGVGDDVHPVTSEPGRYQEFYRGLSRAIRGLEPSPVDPRDAIAGLEIIEAARLSAAERRVVRM